MKLDDETVATTDGNGTATVTLPLEASTSLTVSAAGQTRETTISGMLRNAAAIAVVVLGTLVGLGVATLRNRGALRRRLGVLPRLPSLFSSSLVGLLVDAATAADRSSDPVGASPTAQGDDSTATGRDGLFDRHSLGSLRARLGRLLAGVRGRLDRTDGTEAARPATRQVTIREAWQRFLDRLSLSEPETRTPGELATHAVETDDLPEPAVTTLRDSFRAVEYGARSPADRLASVQQALEQIERADGENETDGDGPTTDADGSTRGGEPDR